MDTIDPKSGDPKPTELQALVRAFQDFRWQGVELMPYKEEGSAPFKAI